MKVGVQAISQEEPLAVPIKSMDLVLSTSDLKTEPNNKNTNLNNSVNNANESLLNELDNYKFDLDINNIDKFVLLEDGIDINTIYGIETLNNINNADEDIIIRESDINLNIENIDELVVLEDKIDHNIFINTNSETEMNININNAIENNNNNIISGDINVLSSEADEDLIVGVSGESYKKMKKDKSFEVVKKKKMKENDCLVKKNVKMSVQPLVKLKDWPYLINIAPIKRTYVLHTSNRSSTYRYFVSVKKEVCRKFILSTLDISEKLLRYTRDNKIDLYVSKHDNKGKQPSKIKTADVIIGNVDRFIQMLPAVPSHYCRGSSSKKYITNDFNSLEHVYRVYIEDCKLNNKPSVSCGVFKKRWNTEYNIGIHVPKKDKCTFCEGFTNNETKTAEDILNYEHHIAEKKFTHEVFKQDQLRSGKNGFLCCSFDLQKVLNTPCGNSMLLFYSRKLAYYNLSIYKSNTKNGHCYLWSEPEVKRGSNEIASILFKYLKTIDETGTFQEIALYCDSCPEQNKNHVVLSMLRYFQLISKNINSLTINYLLPGHTYMPVDSMHACIEKYLKRKTVWAPSEWPTIIRNSRTKFGPYNTVELNHSDFLDWSEVCKTMFNQPKLKDTDGCDVKFKKIRTVYFNKEYLNNFKIAYSFNHNDDNNIILDYKNVSITENRLRSKLKNVEPKQLYFSKLPITETKYNDLKQLCTKKIIPDKFHSEYLEIPFKSTIRDELAETDEEG
ncbi:hypothetical protein AGLY_002180 [Aphis glycines]|uniref:DUF7869 domain-containing protein n=1 Tax=Aphis glycines TaxID=307491 RepID=A0A6G0U3M5_APHGL|nr:hypothetical protein AGLY_002180 [Aphis glycines]